MEYIHCLHPWNDYSTMGVRQHMTYFDSDPYFYFIGNNSNNNKQ